MLTIIVSTSPNEQMQLILTFIIVSLIGIGEILTIIRIIVKVNFKKAFDDLKSPFGND